MKPLIVQVVSSLSAGGAERVALEIAARLPREHFRCELLCAGPGDEGRNPFENPLEVEAARRRVPVRKVRFTSIRDAKGRGEVVRYLHESGAALVHVHNRPTDWQVLALARLVGVKGLYTRHLPYKDLSGRQKLLYATAARLAPAVVAVSEPVRRHLVETEHAPAKKVQVIANGIDLQKFAPLSKDQRAAVRAELGIGQDAFVWICAARLAEQKGHGVLLGALAQLPENPQRHILLAGEGPLRKDLESRAHALGISDRVHFLGARADVPALLGASDAYVCASLSEGHPLSVLEALAMDLPTVAPRLASITAVGAENFLGLFGPEHGAWARRHDPAQLVAAMQAVESRGGPQEGARAFIATHFSIDRMISAHEALYREILGDGP